MKFFNIILVSVIGLLSHIVHAKESNSTEAGHDVWSVSCIGDGVRRINALKPEHITTVIDRFCAQHHGSMMVHWDYREGVSPFETPDGKRTIYARYAVVRKSNNVEKKPAKLTYDVCNSLFGAIITDCGPLTHFPGGESNSNKADNSWWYVRIVFRDRASE